MENIWRETTDKYMAKIVTVCHGVTHHVNKCNYLIGKPQKDPPFLIGKPSINGKISGYLIGKPSTIFMFDYVKASISMGHFP